MKLNTKWTKVWPTKPGMYWFYGYPFGKDRGHGEKGPELNLVKILKISNGILYIRDGNMWYKIEGGIGLFCDVDLPEFPVLE